MQIPPYIPDNAPFTPEQRNWLNGFLAGLYSTAGPVADPPPALKIAVLYASQSGTAESLARKVTKDLKEKGHIVSLISLEGYTPAALFAERYAILVASTYGEGDAPDAVQPFYEQLCLEHFPCCGNLNYAVLALGDSSYEHFCKFGKDLDNKLAALGGVRLADRVDCDVDLDASFAQWKTAVYACLDETIAAHPARTMRSSSAVSVTPVIPAASSDTDELPPTPAHNRTNPYLAPLVDKRPLTHEVSSKLTLHLAFNISDSSVTYEAGDACGVIPQNDLHSVGEILHRLNFSSQVPVQLPRSGTTTLHDALLNHLQITRLTRKMIEAYVTIGKQTAQCHTLSALLAPEQQAHLEKYTYDRGLIDLLHDYPNILHDPADLVAMLPNLSPRLYSISSSPYAHVGEIHTTVAVVRYHSHNRDRGGVCSTLLADRVPTGDRLPIYIQPNKKFRLPKDTDAPVIMIGPGTGIAPFRSFLHQRRVLGHTGRNWLFFGERSATTDFLYQDELQSMCSDGHLTRLDLAFSRDQDRKIYVQDRMLEQAATFYAWLEEGASIYVCGDASRMAKDVESTLHAIVEQQAALSREGATEYISQLKDQNRYHRDVY
ncbi:diflavin oxidoreductase [Tunturibacter empetritectus]|uniref:assimilatory sulfite reductase (NADPH) n=1 Tax=Tunturiibacter empetritectus TaxID=3069691 RepID=A0A7W8IJ29_9BACT|nr:sulfite reductase flavoprotein subunit alpha [Edaphobacter lichenicola]MBB5318091.1 sulfite reductase (NADPH) flavoprotein alpha-component [Edaphobacter lichenicola]